ncbi:MAG: segregation/condensation protein A [candidate division Zixibacteria bacterium]|nr:segregation/condensation protein A [candidate division Zixibacteria bacterium]
MIGQTNLETTEPVTNGFPVKLEGFEGPLDLLLYLIRNQEIDIYDIPVARITEQYLKYLSMMKLLNLEIAGEYVLMAATLIRIKARLLMPRHEEIEGEEEDPREELIVALLEYKKYKEASERLRRFEVAERQIRTREDFSYLEPEVIETFTVEASLYDLVRAFHEVMEQAAREKTHEVDNFDLSIEDQVEHILNMLTQVDQVTLSKLVEHNRARLYYVITFLALLELVKLQRISLRQQASFGEIYVRRI